jgi:hypothetical protein
MNVAQWMSWEGGVDLVGLTQENISSPNVIVHVARMVHTPVGSAPAGMILWQPEAHAAPLVCGFVSTDATVGAYFGANIFAGTPFENAPVLVASIDITHSGNQSTARVETSGFVFELSLQELGGSELIQRSPSAMAPFFQQGLERVAGAAALKINGESITVTVPPTGISGGPAAVVSPCGIYAR